MGFQEQYRLLEIIADKEVRVFRAVQTATGRSVLVHQILSERTPAGSPALPLMVFQFSQAAAQKGASPFLDMGDFGGHVYVVTEDAAHFLDLRAWLTAQMAKPAEPTEPVPPSGTPISPPGSDLKPSSHAGGQTAQFFPSPEILGKGRPAAPPSPAPGATPTASSAPSQAPGPVSASEDPFDKLFGLNKGATGTPSPPTPTPSDSQPSAPEVQGQGEFTRRFSGLGEPTLGEAAPPSERPGPPSAGVPGASLPLSEQPTVPLRPPITPERPAGSGSPQAPGEFTRMFSGQAKPATPASPATPGPASAPARPPVKPGPSALPQGFAVVFRSKKQQPKVEPETLPADQQPTAAFPTPRAAEGKSGTFTQFFQQGEKPASPTSGSTQKPQTAPPQPTSPGAQAPGEFTRMFYSRPAQPTATPADSEKGTQPPAAPTAPTRPDSGGAGEFTRLFSSQPPHKPAEESAPAEPLPQAPLPPSRPPVHSEGPGEFTRMFQGGGEPSKRSESPLPSSPSHLRSSSPVTQQGPGEFTAMMQGYKPPRPSQPLEPPSPLPQAPPSPAPAGGKDQPGEFTMLFQSPRKPAATPPPPPPRAPVIPPPAPVQPAPPSGPGEYTRIVSGQTLQQITGQPGAPPPVAPPPVAPVAPVPMQPMQMPVMPQMQMPQPTMQPPQAYIQPGQIQAGPVGVSMQTPQVTPVMPAVPGQFAPAMQPLNVPIAAPPLAQAPPQPAKKRSLLPLIIILGSIFVVTLGLILFFALRH